VNEEKRRYWLAGNREPGQDAFFVEALDPALWREGDGENWDTGWHTGMPAPEVFKTLNAAKTINHIPGNNGLTVKNYLFQTLAAASDRLTGERRDRMAFFPRVYAMPEECFDLYQAAARHPDKRWILKPKNSSRGRGVRVLRDVAAAPLSSRFLVQDYIDRPHLMNARKYVLRLYVLVTSVEPLRVYFYREGFAKLASEPYDADDPDNPFSNLTNPDINAENTGVEAPVVFVTLADYRKWLRAGGHDDAALFAKIRDLLVLTMIAARDKMRTRTRAVGADTSGCYELLGVDCLIDADLKPWILECNLSPSLEVCAAPDHGGEEERRIKRQLVADMAALLGLNEPPPDLAGLSMDERIRRRTERELARAGGFERIFPDTDVEEYLSFFPAPRYADIVSAEQITGRRAPGFRFAPNRTIEIISEDDLALYSEKTGTLYAPNPSASWIWLKAIDGADPEEIARDLIAARQAADGPVSPADEWSIREKVWEVLADWAGLGLIRRRAGEDADAAAEESLAGADWAGSDKVRVGDRVVEIRHGCPAAAERLRAVLRPTTTGASPELSLAIQRARVGYAVAVGSRLIGADLSLANVAPVVRQALFERAPGSESDIAMQGALVPIGEGEAVFVAGAFGAGWDGLAACLAEQLHADASGGALLDLNTDGSAAPLDLAVWIDEDDVEEIETALGRALAPQIHQWPAGGEGRLMAAARPVASTRYKVRAVVIPARRQEADAAMRAISVHEALRALIPLCAGPRLRLTCAAASGFSDWLSGRDLWTLEFSRFAGGAAMLAERFARENA